jgi:hypothetical protein
MKKTVNYKKTKKELTFLICLESIGTSYIAVAGRPAARALTACLR